MERVGRGRRGVTGGYRGRAAVMVAMALVGAAACESPAGPGSDAGYDFALSVAPAVVYRWPAGAAVGVYVAGGADEARAQELSRALELALADWQAVLPEGTVRLAVVDRLEDADVVVRWSDVVPPVRTVGCEPVVTGRAATTFCATADGRRLRRFPLAGSVGGGGSRVRMLVTVLAAEAGDSVRVRQLVAHELGHVLGIGGHSSDPDDLMWEGRLTALRPSEADRATLRRLYATRPTLVP